jgi:hypothetical protein
VNLDLAMRAGFSTFCEEVYHVWQYKQRGPIKAFFSMFMAGIWSTLMGKGWHDMKSEKDAAVFVKRVNEWLQQNPGHINAFKALR